MNIDECRNTIQEFSLDNCKHGNQGYKRVLLQLFGLPGNGKSSFINSCKFVLDGVYAEHAEVRATYGACTTRRISHQLTDAITMVDNRGCPTLLMQETGEIFAQLGNLLPLDEEVEWVTDYNKNVDRLMKEFKTPNTTDFIVPVFLHSAQYILMTPDAISPYKDLLQTARCMTGINPIVVLTHKSCGGISSMRKTFEDIGMDKIFALENYTRENHQKVLGQHEEILRFLCQVLREVEFCMETERKPRDEGIDRLTFILKYLKEIADNKKEQEKQKQNECNNREKKRSNCTLL